MRIFFGAFTMGSFLNKYFTPNEEGKVTIREIIHDLEKYSLYGATAAIALMIVGFISLVCFGPIVGAFGNAIYLGEITGIDAWLDNNIIDLAVVITIGFILIISGWVFIMLILHIVKIYTIVKDKWKSWKD